MNNKRLLSLLLSAAMMVSTIPMTMATTVAAAGKVELGDDALELATASVTGTPVNEDDGNKYLHVYDRTGRSQGVALTVDYDFVTGEEYYMSFDIKGTFVNSQQRVGASKNSDPVNLIPNQTHDVCLPGYKKLSTFNAQLAAHDNVASTDPDYANHYKNYFRTFAATGGSGRATLVPTTVASEEYTLGGSKSGNVVAPSAVGHALTIKFTDENNTAVDSIVEDSYIGYTFNMPNTWTHAELLYIPAENLSALSFNLYEGGGDSYCVPVDIDNVEVFTFDDAGEKNVIYSENFENCDAIADADAFSPFGAASLTLDEEGDYERISGGSIVYSGATLTPGTYTLAGAVRIANQAAKTATATASATIVSDALAADKTYTITSEWTPLDYEFEVTQETELDLAFNFGTTEKVDLKGLSLVKTYEDTAIQIYFDPATTTVNAGGEISVDIVAKAEDEVTLGAFNFQVDCDNDALTLVEIVADEDLKTVDGEIAIPQIKNNKIAWVATDGAGVELDSDGVTIATVTYKAAASVDDGDVANLSLSDIDVTTIDLEAFVPYSTGCAITLRALYDITLDTVTNGKIDVEGKLTGIPAGTEITVDGDTVTIGDTTLTAVPDQNYEFEAWTGVTAGELEGNLTIGATFKAASTGSQINVVGVDGNTSTNATIENVVDTYGGLLEFIVVPAEGYIYEVSSDDVTLNDAGENKWQSGENLNGAVIVTVLVRKVDTVTIKANEQTNIDADVVYTYIEGKGLYSDETLVDALPEITVDTPAENATVWGDLPAKYMSGENEVTAADILAGKVIGDITIALGEQYKIFFEVEEGSKQFITVDASKWFAKGEAVAAPNLTVAPGYGVEWDVAFVPANGSTTYTATAVANAIDCTFNYVDAYTESSATVSADPSVKAVVGQNIVVSNITTPEGNFVVENVTAEGYVFTSENGVWTSDKALDGETTALVITVTFCKLVTVTVKAGDAHTSDDAVYTAKQGVSGLIEVTELPAIGYFADDDKMYEAVDAPYVVGGVNKTASEVVTGTYTEDTEITVVGTLKWRVTFAIYGDNVTFEGKNAPYSEWVTDGETVTAPELVPAQYYTAEWDKDVVTPVNAAATYTAKATPNTYTFTATEGKVEATGLNDENKAVYGQAIELTFTLEEGEIVTLKIGEAEAAVITPVDNKYTIAGNEVIGNIVVTVSLPVVTINVPAGVTVNGVVGGDDAIVEVAAGSTITIVPNNDDVMVSAVKYGDSYATRNDDGSYSVVVNAEAEITLETYTYNFIEADDYMGLAEGTRILVLGENEVNGTVYTLTYSEDEAETLYYSEKYAAYVAIVDDDYTAADLAAILTAEAGDADEVNYDGDVNGVGGNTAGDAALVSDILHNVKTDVDYDDIIRLRADVNGDKKVTTTDAKKALYISVGKA